MLCKSCTETQLIPAPSRCYRCHAATKQFQTCSSCRKSVALTHVWVVGAYEDLYKNLLYVLKFQRVAAASRDIARCMDSLLPLLPKETMVCHIPTAHARIRIRGYDQSKLIAKALSRSRGYRYGPLLVRKNSTRQLGASRAQRFSQAEEAFVVKHNLKGTHILIIDDVTTSGATLEAAARLLKKAGATTVDACVFAQAID